MLNVNIFDALAPDASIFKYLNSSSPLELTVLNYKQFRTDLLTLLKERFESQIDIYELISLNTCIMDALLKNIWTEFKIPADKAALIAIGGYGRRELFPESDIDIMIVLQEGAYEEIKTKVEAFLTFLWDINLPIAQSVRTAKDCVTEAKKDITVMTSLMELYFLSGSKDIYSQIYNLANDGKLWPSKKYFKEKKQELDDRHHKFGDTANHLEPNVKENPGGLRDIHTLRWLTNRHFKTNSFEELTSKEFLSKNELSLIRAAYKVIAKIRFALHLHAQRSEDRLLFDYQYEVASLLGFSNENRNLQVEEFMQIFYRSSNQLSTLSEIIINRLHSIIFPGLFKRKAKILNEKFQVRAHLLEAKENNIFKKSPSAILEAFQLLQEHENLNGFSDQLQKLIIENLGVIDEKFRKEKNNCNALFL